MEPGRRLGVAAAAGVAGLALAAGVWFGTRTPEPLPVLGANVTSSSENRQPTSSIVVHVAGAVAQPGLVALEPGARVADAVSGAGGVLPVADLSALNLATEVGDGQQVVVPARSSGSGSLSIGPSAAADDGLVHLNSAGPAELEQIPGVGSVLAGRIIAHREANGPFNVIEDLLDVPGIGEGKLAAIRESAVVP